MGACKTCGQKAGFLKSECSSCKQIRTDKEKRDRIKQQQQYERAKQKKIERFNIVQGWITVLMEFTSDHLLDEKEEQILNDYKVKHNIEDHEISSINKNALTIFEVYIELRDYIKNKTLPKFDRRDYMGMNFMKSEAPFLCLPLPYYEETKVRISKGRSDGYSIRIMKGVWARQNFHNPAVHVEELVMKDVGEVVLTNKHIYFKGQDKSFRHRLDKLVEITPYTNGIQIMKDTASAKPQFFGIAEGASLGKGESPEHFAEICNIFCHIAATLSGNM